MFYRKFALVAALGAVVVTSACTDSKELNAMTGALGGAALGSAVGNGSGRTAAMLAGAAAGTVVGANAPRN